MALDEALGGRARSALVLVIHGGWWGHTVINVVVVSPLVIDQNGVLRSRDFQ